MRYKDEFDDGPDLKAAIGSIFKVLDRRDRITPRRPVWAAAIVVCMVLFLGCVLWYSYPREVEKREIMSVPIIRADAGPYKVVPKDPGGLDIPHRDSTIFDTLHAENKASEHKIESLLPEEEEPIDREQLFAGLGLKVEGREVIKATKKETAAAKPAPVGDLTEEVTVATAEPVKQEEIQKIASAAPVPKSKPEAEVAQELSRTEPAAGVEIFETPKSGGYYVQLASLRAEQAAESSWKDLQKSLSVLNDMDHRVVKADLGAKGIYYRLQTGPYTEARAQSICASVKAQRPGGCIVIKD